jgi:tRNA 2-thiouridine synthesizing protein A
MTSDPMATVRPDRELSCRGLRCPLPVIYTRKALATMQRGQILRVVATDPGSPIDIAEFADRTGTELVALDEAGGECVFPLRKP